MTELYLLVLTLNGQPKVTVYPNEQQACISYEAEKSNGAKVYKVTEGKRSDPAIAEGDCKPIQQFVIQGK